MVFNAKQLESLKKINQNFQTKYGANAPYEFKKYVTNTYGADKYEFIKSNLSQNVAKQNSGVINPPSNGPVPEVKPTQAPAKTGVSGVINPPSNGPVPEVTKNRVLTPQQVEQQNKIAAQEFAKVQGKPVNDGQKTTIDIGTQTLPLVTPTEAPKQPVTTEYKPVVSLQDWIDRGKKPTELVDYVEKKYGITAEYDAKTNTINGFDAAGNKVKQWTFDAAGNAERTDLKQYSSENFISDFGNLVNSGADRTQIEDFLKKNSKLSLENKDSVISIYKNFEKNNSINQKATKLSALDGKGLYDAYLKGDFVKGDNTWNLLPDDVKNRFDEYYTKNQKLNYSKTDKDGNLVPIVANLESKDEEEIYNSIARHDPLYYMKYNEIIKNNPERKSTQDSLLNTYKQIEEKRLELSRLKDAIKKKYPSASPSFIQAVLNRDSGTLKDEIDQLTSDYNVGAYQFKMIDDDLQAEYGAYIKGAKLEYNNYQEAVKIKLDRIKTGETQANAKDMLKLQQDHTVALEKMREAYDWRIANFNQANQDKKGEYVTNSNGELLYIVKGQAQKVMDLGGSVVSTKSSDNYSENVVENKLGGYTVIRTYKDGSQPTISVYNANGTLSSGAPTSVINALNSIPSTGKQCGEAVNDYLQKLGVGRIMGDTYESKKEDINSYTPAVGGIAIWNPNKPNGKFYENGHTGIITNISSDGQTLEITSWNKNGDQKKTVEKVSRKDIEATGGYYIPELKEETGDDKLSNEAKNWVDLWNKGTMDLETILTKIGSSNESLPLKNEISKYVSQQGGVAYRKIDDPAVKEVMKMQQSIKDLLSEEKASYREDVSGGFQLSPWDTYVSKGKTDYLKLIQNLLDNKTLQNLIDAKAKGATFGALSNEELRMLQASSSILNASAIRDEKGNITGFDMSESAFKNALINLDVDFSDKIQRMTGSQGMFDPLGLINQEGSTGVGSVNNSSNPLGL